MRRAPAPAPLQTLRLMLTALGILFLGVSVFAYTWGDHSPWTLRPPAAVIDEDAAALLHDLRGEGMDCQPRPGRPELFDCISVRRSAPCGKRRHLGFPAIHSGLTRSLAEAGPSRASPRDRRADFPHPGAPHRPGRNPPRVPPGAFPSQAGAMPTAADRLVQFLAARGVDRAWCVPGESYIALLHALHPDQGSGIDLVVNRHEGGAGFAALADAKLSGRPGVVLVSRGPGASNAAIALHAAEQDCVPLILLIGQVEARDLRRRAFQEIDYAAMFGDVAKWVGEARTPMRCRG